MATTTVLAVLLLQVSAPGPENWAYVTCMISSASEVLKEKPSRAEYRRRLESFCEPEKAVLRQLIVSKQISAGRSPAEAEQDANDFFAESGRQMLSLQPVNAR